MHSIQDIKSRFKDNPTAYFFYQNQENDEDVHHKAKMISKGLFNIEKCPICASNYDMKNKLPRILTQCGKYNIQELFKAIFSQF